MKTVFIAEQGFTDQEWKPFNERMAELDMAIYKRSEVREIMDTIVKLRQELSFERGRAHGIPLPKTYFNQQRRLIAYSHKQL